jgi:hypothetical protein
LLWLFIFSKAEEKVRITLWLFFFNFLFLMDNVGPAFTLYLNHLLCGLLQDCALELVFQLFLRLLK